MNLEVLSGCAILSDCETSSALTKPLKVPACYYQFPFFLLNLNTNLAR